MLATSMKIIMWLLFVLVAACTRPPSPLVDSLVEGMQESEAVAALRLPRTAFKVVNEDSLPKGDSRPPYSEKTISAGMLSCAGQPSDIELSFYLGELRQVTCYPQDAKGMISALIKTGTIEKDATEFKVDRGGVIISGGRVDGRWGVVFSSKRLDAKQRAWISKYA